MATQWTDFREYPRGAYPGDMTSLWNAFDGAYVDGSYAELNNRNVLRLSMTASARRCLLWNAVATSVGLLQQESMILFRIVGPSTVDSNLAVLRGGGIAGSETGYTVSVSSTGSGLSIRKYVAGVNTVIQTSAGTHFRAGGIYVLVYRVSGLVPPYTLMVKTWKLGDAVPVGWLMTPTDSSITSPGLPGVMWTQSTSAVEILALSVATGGDSASIPDVAVLDQWIGNPSAELDITMKFRYYDPLTDNLYDFWAGINGRTTGPMDYPPSTTINNVLAVDSLGSIGMKVEADAQLSGLALPEVSAVQLYNEPFYTGGPGPLDSWSGYSFYGYPIEVRLGQRWLTPPSVANPDGVLNEHRRYELIGCGVSSQEPDIGLTRISFPLGSLGGVLNNRLTVRTNRGISTGVRNLSSLGVITIPANVAYDLTSYNISTCLFIPSTGFAGSGFADLSSKVNGSGFLTWFIGVGQASHATFPNYLRVACHTLAGVALVQFSYNLAPLLGSWVDVIFCVKGGVRWYLIVNNNIVGGGTLTGSPIINNGFPVKLLNAGCVGAGICDHRIEYFVEEDEARTRFAARREPDSLNISMHRCDDNGGSSITDYNPITANSGTLGGANGIDREWMITYLGSQEMAGNAMPFYAGVVFHAPTQNSDAPRDIHRVGDKARPAHLTLGLRAQGALLTLGVGYSEPADGPGTVRGIGTTLSQPVTYGLTAATTPEDFRTHLVQVVSDELAARGGAKLENFDFSAFSALRKILPMKGGFAYTEPPTVAELLNSRLGAMGAYYGLDGKRLYTAAMTPPMLPDYWGGLGPILEGVGYDNRGVTLNWDSTYGLTDSPNNFSIQIAFRSYARLIDGSVSSTFTHFPSGYEIASHYNPAGGQGWYLGIDGRNGNLIFATIGQTNVSGGAHFTSIPYAAWHSFVQRFGWVLIRAIVNANQRTLIVLNPISAGNIPIKVDTVSGSYVPASDFPIKIGHGFPGAVSHFVASSPGYNALSGYGVSARPTIQANERIFLPMTDGSGDYALEEMRQRQAVIDGMKWAPKMKFNLDQVFGDSPVTLLANKRIVPAWKIDAQYKPNLAVLTGANIVASVSASDRQALGRPYLSIMDTSEKIRSKFLQAKDIALMTGLVVDEDVRFVEELIKRRMSPSGRLMVIGNWNMQTIRLKLGDEVLVVFSRFGETVNGLPIRVASSLVRLSDGQGDVTLVL